MENAPAIETEGLTKRYGNFVAISDVSLTVKRGEFMGLLGPNGAGKSTTLKAITGLLKPTSGSVRIAGIDIRDHRRAMEHVGCVIETPEPYPEFTPAEIMQYVGRLYGLDSREIEIRARDVLETVRMWDWRNEKIGEFSKGMRQRIVLAQALLPNPDTIILDEPTSGLDPRGMIEIRRTLTDLRSRDRSLLISTHILSEVSEICGAVTMIRDGRVIASGDVSSLIHDTGAAKEITLEVRTLNPLTPQFVLRDLLYAREGSGNTAVYGAYKAWNGEQIDTEAYFLDYGERADTEERTLTMRGSLAEGPAREVIAAWTDGEGETNTLRITAREETQYYDVGFARKDGSDILPPVYVECEKEMTVYTLEFTLPALDVAKKTEQSLVLFLNWTKEIVNTSVSADQEFWNVDMPAKQKFSFENQAVVGGDVVSTGEEITVLGYHYDVTGVPVVGESGAETNETTTVRVRHIFGEEITYQHVASLNDRDGNYAHDFAPVAENSNIYQCQNKLNENNRICIDVNKISTLTDFSTVTLVSISDPANPGGYLKENYAPIYQRGFLVAFAAAFVQDSESPAAAAQP